MNERKYDPITGQPIEDNTTRKRNFDPITGQPLSNNTTSERYFDPITGQPIAGQPFSQPSPWQPDVGSQYIGQPYTAQPARNFQAIPNHAKNNVTTQKQVYKKGISPAKVMILCAAIVALIAVSVTIYFFPIHWDKQATDEQASASASEGQSGDADKEDENQYAQYISTFSINGKSYTLPAKLQTFLNEGWSFHNPDDASMTLDKFESQKVYLEYQGKQYTDCSFYIMNSTLDSLGYEECMVYDVSFSNTFAKSSGADIKMCNDNFIIYTTTPDEVKELLDAPTKTITNDKSVTLKYIIDSERYESYTAYTFEENVLTSVEIVNELTLDYPKLYEVDTKVPYLIEEYKAPESLGDNPLSGNFSLNGVIYNLPVPLKVFVDNGWTYTKDEYQIISPNDYVYITLKKDNDTFFARACNPLSSEITLKNAIVIDLSESEDINSELKFVLPGNIRSGMTKDELLSILNNGIYYIERKEDRALTEAYTIPYDGETSDNYPKDSIDIFIDPEKNTVSTIRITKEARND